jgi:hypothetical protein
MPIGVISRATRQTASSLFGAALLCCASAFIHSALAHAQSSDDKDNKKQLVLRPDIPGVQVNHRLILKDGTFQVVRKYEVVGDRVRYISVERSGEWEELPNDLVDWPATQKWEKEQVELAAQAQSPAMAEAAELDKEEAAERESNKFRRPEVARGLNLPDQDGVYLLDEYRGTPELVEIVPATSDLQMSRQHGIRSVLPLQGQLAHVELDGPAARIHIHVNNPTLYLSLDDRDDKNEIAEQVTTRSFTVDTHGVNAVQNRKRGAASAASGFAIVRVDARKSVRVVGTVHIGPTGNITQDENVVPATAEILPGKHWLKLTPKEPLTIGEYALVEILSPKEMNATVWDFQVNPRADLNETAIGPIQSQ